MNPQPKRKKKKSLSKVRTEALTAMQLLRRLEESDERGYCYCISCGKRMFYKQAQGGHYIPRRHRSTELEPDNINPQCARCNGFLSGNTILYRDNLVKSIGLERVERLENMFRAEQGDEDAMDKLSLDDQIKVNMKKKISDYQELIKDLKKCIKVEKERLGEC
ncbi:MAG: recombination protein NinG [Christensenellales bacterium]